MAAGQQDMIKKHEVLKASQENVQTYIANNLRELTREKALISAGHKELADMTENIKRKLGIIFIFHLLECFIQKLPETMFAKLLFLKLMCFRHSNVRRFLTPSFY